MKTKFDNLVDWVLQEQDHWQQAATNEDIPEYTKFFQPNFVPKGKVEWQRWQDLVHGINEMQPRFQGPAGRDHLHKVQADILRGAANPIRAAVWDKGAGPELFRKWNIPPPEGQVLPPAPARVPRLDDNPQPPPEPLVPQPLPPGVPPGDPPANPANPLPRR